MHHCRSLAQLGTCFYFESMQDAFDVSATSRSQNELDCDPLFLALRPKPISLVATRASATLLSFERYHLFNEQHKEPPFIDLHSTVAILYIIRTNVSPMQLRGQQMRNQLETLRLLNVYCRYPVTN